MYSVLKTVWAVTETGVPHAQLKSTHVMWILLFSFRVVVFNHITLFFSFIPINTKHCCSCAFLTFAVAAHSLPHVSPLSAGLWQQRSGSRSPASMEALRSSSKTSTLAQPQATRWGFSEGLFTFGLCMSVVGDFVVSGSLWNSLFALAVKYICPATELNCLLHWMCLPYSMCL